MSALRADTQQASESGESSLDMTVVGSIFAEISSYPIMLQAALSLPEVRLAGWTAELHPLSPELKPPLRSLINAALAFNPSSHIL